MCAAWRRLIQSYQALGMNEQRDSQRAAVLALRAALPPADRDKMVFFARDQFDAGGVHFVTLEYFEPHGRFHDLYHFDAADAAHKPAYYLAVENDESTTQVARELGEIGKEAQIYSLDRFDSNGTHSTLALLKALPSYDTLRAMVIARSRRAIACRRQLETGAAKVGRQGWPARLELQQVLRRIDVDGRIRHRHAQHAIGELREHRPRAHIPAQRQQRGEGMAREDGRHAGVAFVTRCDHRIRLGTPRRGEAPQIEGRDRGLVGQRHQHGLGAAGQL